MFEVRMDDNKPNITHDGTGITKSLMLNSGL